MKILITGGAGSIGRELTKKALLGNPSMVIIFDNDETKLFELEQDIDDRRLRCVLGDVRDQESIRAACRDIDIVFHTADLKHVKSCEQNPLEAVKTNIIGLRNVIEACRDNNVKRLVFTSSDKAVNPVNIMGITKLFGEKLITGANAPGSCKFSSVRFGNVLGTRGSLLPLLKSQIQKGGPVTVTDPKMSRFYMTEDQAADLILKTSDLMKGGEIFVLKMPVFRVGDIVKAAIESSGKDVRTVIIGPKTGEKMYEELMTIEESRRAFELNDMFVVRPEGSREQYGGSKAKISDYSSHNESPANIQELKNSIRNLI